MNDPSRPSLLERLSAMLLREPEDREQLLELLRSAHQRDLLDADALSIIEGALTVSEMQVRDIMIPRAQMDVIDINEPRFFILLSTLNPTSASWKEFSRISMPMSI